MITLPELAAEALGSFLASDMKDRFGSSHARLAELIPFAARLALECIGTGDALYHNVEHTTRLPDVARQVLQVLANQIEQIEAAVAALEKQLMAWHKTNAVSQRLASIPGIGPIIATAIAATVVEPSGFRSGREFAAWLGLVPRQNSTGGKHRLGGISKRGNQYLRRLLINGASANLLRSKATNADPWVIGLRQRRPSLVVAVALANKTARIAWAVMHRHENYQRVAAAA
jgi:transposase